jgi:tetratricopeptide (TPR) repeat protein
LSYRRGGQDADFAWRIVKKLEDAGLRCAIDERDFSPDATFLEEMERCIRESRFTLAVLSPRYLDSGNTTEEAIIAKVRDMADRRRRLVPLILETVDRPIWLYNIVGIDFVASDPRVDPYEKLLALFGIKTATPTPPSSSVPRAWPDLPPALVSIARLPNTREFLFGRNEQLAQLDKAWEDSSIHVVTIVAPGGVGKSALVNHWLGQMDKDHYRGAERVWAWSFYSQGSSGQAQSAEEFFREALAEFGDPDPGAGSPFQRGERLAKLVRQLRSLLILDGLEPLQHPPGPLGGRLKDPGLVALLKNLAASNPGLCVVTTRETVAELGSREKTSAPKIDLRTLSDEAGAALLRELGTLGLEKELRQAAHEYSGHSLSILLLGNYLRQVCDGEVRQRDKVKLLEQDEEEGGHAKRVLAAYENFLGEGKELSILRLLGFFDRPADMDSLEALREAPPISRLTEALFERKRRKGPLGFLGFTELVPVPAEEIAHALARLRDLGLVAPGSANAALDTHPLVRTYFGELLRTYYPDTWREGNLRLYRHLKDKAIDLPETFAEMELLYSAVIHGCRAGKPQEALDEIYRRRIQRGDEYFSANRLGALGVELSTLAGFFAPPWKQPSQELTPGDQAYLLNQAAFRLRALGRLTEAVGPMREGLEMRVQQEDWKNAAIDASNLSLLTLILGDLTEALATAERSVELADRSGDQLEHLVNITTYAAALHKVGRVEESESFFLKAEREQTMSLPQSPRLSSLANFRFCDLQLGLIEAKWAEMNGIVPAKDVLQLIEASEGIRERGEHTVKRALSNSLPVHTTALDQLTLGRAHHLLSILYLRKLSGAGEDTAALAWQARLKAAEHLDRAVDGLRSSGREDILPIGLLGRAAFRRTVAEYTAATADLDEALEIAERDGMRLHECDAHLEKARLFRATGDLPAAREHLTKAAALVEATGYHRRDREVAALARQLKEAVPNGVGIE